MRVEIDGVTYVPAREIPSRDMPKLESPFVRVDQGKRRIVTPQIAEGFEWVFEDPDVLASEKLDGIDVSVVMQGGEPVALYNRANKINFGVLDNNRFIAGIRVAAEKGRIPPGDGQHFGELMGPHIQTNFLKLATPEWFPFDYLREKFSYRSYHQYAKTFENISKWFKDDLFSLMYVKLHGAKVPPEGIVFYQPSTGKMAKLRRDMFDWYTGKGHQTKE